MNSTTKIIVIGAASLALAGGVTAGIAAADPSTSPTPSTSATPTPGTKKADKSAEKNAGKKAERKAARKADQQAGGGAREIRRALHGEVTLAGKQHEVVVFQRGKVASVDSSTITLRSNDAFTGTYALAPTTKVRAKLDAATIGDVEPGDRVLVIANKSGDVSTARVVVRRGD